MSSQSEAVLRESIRVQLSTEKGRRQLVDEIREDLLLFYRLMKGTATGADDGVDPKILAQRRLAAGMAKDLAELVMEALREE